MKFIVKVTVSTDRDPTCNPYTLVKTYRFDADVMTHDLKSYVEQCAVGTRDLFMASYPSTQGKPRSASLLPTDVEINPDKDGYPVANDAERLLRQAYASGQLNGTIIGGKLRDYFGVSYDKVEAEPYSDPAAQTISLGDQNR